MPVRRRTQRCGNRREYRPMRLRVLCEARDLTVQCDRIVGIAERALQFAQPFDRSIGTAGCLGFAFGGVAPFLDRDAGAMKRFVVGREPWAACGAHRFHRVVARPPHALFDPVACARIGDPAPHAVERARDIARHIAHAPRRDRGSGARAGAGVPGEQAAIECRERRAFGGRHAGCQIRNRRSPRPARLRVARAEVADVHFGFAHGTKRAADPAQRIDRGAALGLAQRGTPHAERRGQPARGDAQIVNRFGVGDEQAGAAPGALPAYAPGRVLEGLDEPCGIARRARGDRAHVGYAVDRSPRRDSVASRSSETRRASCSAFSSTDRVASRVSNSNSVARMSSS